MSTTRSPAPRVPATRPGGEEVVAGERGGGDSTASFGGGRRARRGRVVAGFDRAIGYHHQALVQRRVAGVLLAEVACLPLPVAPRLLEIGCGTGFLAAGLVGLGGELILSDLSLAMVQRCRALLPAGAARFVVMDGERLAVAGRFDLIASSLVMQWFHDPAMALMGWVARLAPGGYVTWSVLGEETFREWREVCAGEGVACGMPDLPSVAQVEGAMAATGLPLVVREDRWPVRYASSLDFLRHLRAIGADAPHGDHRPTGAGAMRRLLRRQESGMVATYHLIQVIAGPQG